MLQIFVISRRNLQTLELDETLPSAQLGKDRIKPNTTTVFRSHGCENVAKPIVEARAAKTSRKRGFSKAPAKKLKQQRCCEARVPKTLQKSGFETPEPRKLCKTIA